MCGICGIWGRAERETVEAMTAAMHHRGPDDRGVFCDSEVGLGATRLSILDLSPAASQPMSNSEGTVWIAYNGETYNFASERGDLEAKGHRFSSASDTEVVLRLYEQYGDDFLLRLRGMFALAIYDTRGGQGRERLLLARDQLGVKPLLYAYSEGRLVFASELKALLAGGLIGRDIDPISLRLLLTFGSVYQPRTILRGVRMLPPAHRVVVDRSGIREERYWSLGTRRRLELHALPYEELVDEVAAVLEESVRLQLVSDVPLGAFLSGGIDSALLVALMSRAAGGRIKTFSVGFGDEGAEIDESDDARRVAAFLGTDHTFVPVSGADVRDRIAAIARGLDQPSVNGVNAYFVAAAARQAVTVAISGTGGDELFAGYPWFRRMAASEARPRRSDWRAVVYDAAGGLLRQPLFDPLLLKRGGGRLAEARDRAGFVARYSTTYQIFGARGSAALLAPGLRQPAGAGRAPSHDLDEVDELAGASPLERVTALCLRGYTNNQLLRDIDATSMAHSLEVRVPYLDVRMADTALSLPDVAKLARPDDPNMPEGGTYAATGVKRILFDVGRRGLLPPDMASRPKRGFAMPFDAWLRGPLREIVLDTLSEPVVRRRGLLDEMAVASVRDRFLSGRAHWAEPWLLMMLELWCREVLDADSSPVAPLPATVDSYANAP